MLNYVYKTFPHLGSRYTETYGLEQELKRSGRLGYSVNVSDTFVDEDKLKMYPALYMRGGMAGMGPHVLKAGNQFKVSIESESYYSRQGKVDAPGIKDRLKDFGLVITFAESDVDIYGRPTVWMPAWADTYKYED